MQLLMLPLNKINGASAFYNPREPLWQILPSSLVGCKFETGYLVQTILIPHAYIGKPQHENKNPTINLHSIRSDGMPINVGYSRKF